MALLEKKVRTVGNIELRKEMILSQDYQPGAHPTPVDIAREPNIDCRLVSRVIDQDLLFDPLTKRKVRKYTDLTTEKHMLHSRKLLSNLTQKNYNLHSLVARRHLKSKKLYNSHNCGLCSEENEVP